MIISVHQPQYIPWLGYFDKIAKCDSFVFLDCVQYKPREFQNRNKIRTQDGWMWLTVPVVSKGKNKQKICDCLIDDTFPWRRKHLAALKASYGSCKFFKEQLPFFQQLFAKKWGKLAELNVHIINYCLEQLSITKPVYFESQLNIKSRQSERIIEICQKLKADTYLSGAGGKKYLEEEKFVKAGLKLIYQDFVHPVYHQEFMKEKDFIPYMSILDLLFNAGPKIKEVLDAGG